MKKILLILLILALGYLVTAALKLVMAIFSFTDSVILVEKAV